MALLKLVYEIAVVVVVTMLDNSASVVVREEEKTLPKCAICLSKFGRMEKIRLGHSIHSTCVDAWFCVHSSCPSCSRIIVVVDMVPPQYDVGVQMVMQV